MADNVTTPIAAGTAMATKDLAGVHIPKNAIVDQAGADAMGLVTASPAATTLLGRLKAIADGIASVVSGLGNLATSEKQDTLKTSVEAPALVLPPFPITPGSGALSRPIKAIGIKTAGTVIYTPSTGGSDVTVDLAAGMWPMPATHIKSGGTATGLTGF